MPRSLTTLVAGIPLVCTASALTGGGVASASNLPPYAPANHRPSAAMLADCHGSAPNGTCDTASLAAIDAARAGEGLAPMHLPTNYEALTPAEQMLVLFDIERTDRGAAPIASVTQPLDQMALAGAEAGSDPPLPSGVPSAASLWAGGEGTPLFDDFLWMYDDGPGGPNVGSPWGHRFDILQAYPGAPQQVQMGAAVAQISGDPSSAGVVVAAGVGAAPEFTWAEEQPFFLPQPSGGGYRLIAADGGVFTYGNATFLGSTGNMRLNRPLVAAAVTPSRQGYWMAGGDGGVFAFGNAPFLGSTGNMRLTRPVVGMAADPANKGYWLVASDGGIFSFGAPFHGSTGAMHLNRPVVGMATTPDGGGYWLVASDGGIFNFGDARFYGSTGSISLNSPIVSMAATPDGHGYWLVAADGGVFNFGDAQFYGATGGLSLTAPIASIVPAPGGQGYWLTGEDGAVYPFGNAPFLGSPAGQHINAPVIAFTS